MRIETMRLTLRRWREDDVAPMSEIDADPEVMRWIGDGSVRDLAQTREDVARWERGWDEHGFGLFAVEERASGDLLGFTGLSVPRFLPEILPAVEIGWRLARRSWGQGLATEAARAVLSFAFEDRGLDRVVSVAHVENEASLRVMRRIGMRVALRTVVPDTGVPVVVHDLTSAATADPRATPTSPEAPTPGAQQL
ncbi:GNAT family N-acetyltransferase [Mobilicoccus pelagius]|nr:GNAT family N-acetyltransferase [Mobilicoccus pelagius]